MAKYRYVGEAAGTAIKGDKNVPLAPGDFIDLSAEDMKNDDNKELALIPVDKGGEK